MSPAVDAVSAPNEDVAHQQQQQQHEQQLQQLRQQQQHQQLLQQMFIFNQSAVYGDSNHCIQPQRMHAAVSTDQQFSMKPGQAKLATPANTSNVVPMGRDGYTVPGHQQMVYQNSRQREEMEYPSVVQIAPMQLQASNTQQQTQYQPQQQQQHHHQYMQHQQYQLNQLQQQQQLQQHRIQMINQQQQQQQQQQCQLSEDQQPGWFSTNTSVCTTSSEPPTGSSTPSIHTRSPSYLLIHISTISDPTQNPLPLLYISGIPTPCLSAY
jgi:hypothetical protein